MTKKIISAVLAVCMVFGSASLMPQSSMAQDTGITASAQGDQLEYGNYTYVLNYSGNAIIVKYNGDEKNVVVPNKIDGHNVTSVRTRCFEDCESIESIVLPDAVTSLSFDTISRCKNLESVTLPASLSYYEPTAIDCCQKLRTIKIDSKNDNFGVYDGILYSKDRISVYKCPENLQKANITLPGTVTYIQCAAFQNCMNIESVAIPDKVTSITNNAFDGCEKLKKINIPKSVTTIDPDAFSHCTQLESITLPEGLKRIGVDSFKKTGLKEVTIPSTVIFVERSAFALCNNLNSIKVAASNANYSSFDGALYDKKQTTLIFCPNGKASIAFPGTVTAIGEKAFEKACMTSVDIPSTVRSIGDYAFDDSLLNNLVIPGSVSTIGVGAFNSCSLNELILEDGIGKIGKEAFTFCWLKSVVIPESVQEISEDAFSHQNAFGKVQIIGLKGSAAETYARQNGHKFVVLDRCAGKDRYQTSAMISRTGFRTAETVVLASGEKYADALAGVPLAYELSAPVLLTSKNALSANTLYEIMRLDAKNVIILGGTGAVSESVEKELSKNGIKTERIAGADRFDTAVKIGERLQQKTAKKPKEVFFVSAGSFADALSASAPASLKQSPIVFLQKDGTIDEKTKAYLESIKGSVQQAYVIGGTGVISDNMMSQAGKLLGIAPQRVWGKDRYETCISVNNAFSSVLTGSSVCVAKGLDFPDALSGGLLAALRRSPLILADGDTPTDTQKRYLSNKDVSNLYVFGGTGAVSNKLVSRIGEAFKRQ